MNKRKKNEPIELKFEKETYLRSRSFILEEFYKYLECLKTDLNNEFVLAAIFREIRDQQKFVKLKLPHVDTKEEKEILKKMIKNVKIILKKNYTALYEQYQPAKSDGAFDPCIKQQWALDALAAINETANYSGWCQTHVLSLALKFGWRDRAHATGYASVADAIRGNSESYLIDIATDAADEDEEEAFINSGAGGPAAG